MSETLARELGGHVPRMYRVALRMVGAADAAQDVAQEACVKALRSAEKFDGRATMATWLHRITVNCAHDHLRKTRRIDHARTDWNACSMAVIAAVDTGPAKRAEQNEMYRLALDLVAQLPDDCRNAFVLTQLDGYSYDEAAAIDNLSRGTVASRVYRARQLLMEQMNNH